MWKTRDHDDRRQVTTKNANQVKVQQKTTKSEHEIDERVMEIADNSDSMTKWEEELESKCHFNEDQLVDCLSMVGKYYHRHQTFPFTADNDDDIVISQARIGWGYWKKLKHFSETSTKGQLDRAQKLVTPD